MLVWLSWTASYAQTLELSNDTVHCYDRNDMRAIAMRVIEATECDTIISIMQEEIALRDSIMETQQKQLKLKDSEIAMLRTMVDDVETLYQNCTEELQAEVKKHKGTKIKWYVSLAAVIAAAFLTR